MTPKVIIQTSYHSQDKDVINALQKNLTQEWKYLHFNDKDVEDFFKENEDEEFKEITERFYSFSKGAHRADLFRYFYLYKKGGLYIDTDVMLHHNIDDIMQDYTFITVDSTCHPKTVFQGIIGSTPGNEIVKEALTNLYNINPIILNHYYHYACAALYQIIQRALKKNNQKIRLLQEERLDQHSGDNIYNENKSILYFKHHWNSKKIPL